MKYRLIALFAASPLTACMTVSPYAAPISNPLAGINPTPAPVGAAVPLPAVPTVPVVPAANMYAVAKLPVQATVLQPVSAYSPDPLPEPAPLPATAAATPLTPLPPVTPAQTTTIAPVPYPTVEPSGNQINQLAIQNIKLQQQVDYLNKRIAQLEHTTPVSAPAAKPSAKSGKATGQKKKPNKPNKPARSRNDSAPPSLPQPAAPNPPAASATPVNLPDPMAEKLKQARLQYRRGDYKGVLTTLRGADAGGDGSTTARHSMYLLLQTNHRLNYCQSVIQIGLRLASRYANSPEAPEALYTVGECQRGIQQQDIARDTWRKLISVYPNSAAARRARANLNKL